MSAHSTDRPKQGTTSNSTGWMKLLRSTVGEQDTATKKHTLHQTHRTRPQLHPVQARRDSRAHSRILPKNSGRTKGITYLPTSTRVRQTRRRTGPTNNKTKTRQRNQELRQHYHQDQKTTRRSRTRKRNNDTPNQGEARKRKRTKDQKPTKKHKKSHPVEA